MQRKQQGNQGEQLAKQKLTAKGYRFLAQNFRTRYGEIDLIFKDKKTIVFVEVKSRTSNRFGTPQAAVTPAKLATISRVADAYIQEHHLSQHPARIDVVAINPNTDPPLIEHLVDVTN